MNATVRNRFYGRIVLITGASSGLGLAAAHAFGSEGADLVLTARNRDRLQQAAGEIEKKHGSQVLAVPCDVSRRDEVNRLVTQAVAQFGRIDLLVNNAGTSMIAPFQVVRIEDAVSLMQTNFFGALHCIQSVLPHMIAQRSGMIINVASVGGLRGIPNLSIYSATKAALIAFSDALRIEVKDAGVKVIVFCTGRIRDTAIFQRAITYGPITLYQVLDELTPSDAAQAMLKAAERAKPLVIIPRRARLLYTANKFAPRWIDWLLHKRMPKLQRIEAGNPSIAARS